MRLYRFLLALEKSSVSLTTGACLPQDLETGTYSVSVRSLPLFRVWRAKASGTVYPRIEITVDETTGRYLPHDCPKYS